MRDIIFRGLDFNGKWHEGNLCVSHESGNTYIVEKFYETELVLEMERCFSYQVDPKTVGQFTGRFDETEKRIFEGDMVSSSSVSGLVKWCGDGWTINGDLPLRAFAPYIKVIGTIHDDPKEEWNGNNNA